MPRHNTVSLLWRLFLVSFAALFVEIMLIRWVGTEIRVFAYFQNLALIACFLGFGLGCYRSARKKNPLSALLALAALAALVKTPVTLWQNLLWNLSNLLSWSPDAVLWGLPRDLGVEGVLVLSTLSVLIMALLLLLLVMVMVPLGQLVGYYLDGARNPITAYSVNLLGSVAGLWVFAGMSFFRLPPLYWFGLALLLYVVVHPPSWRVAALAVVVFVGTGFLLRDPATSELQTYWSPYQKLQVRSLGEGQYQITTNNHGYMTIANLTPESLAHQPQVAARYRTESSYDAPFRLVERRDRVLIVGAGAGNDAAAALRNGAGEVDAVEIDPVILSVGKELHPEQPYSSPRVREVVNDARAFMRQTDKRYDVILFGLLDSHTQFSTLSNMRIDNYVYTEEAFREAKRLLKPEGILILKFHVRAPWVWLGQRFYAMLGQIFGRPPLTFYAPPLDGMAPATVFMTSKGSALWTRAARPELAALVTKNPPPFPLTAVGAPPNTSDDWPYIYHRSRSIPRAYLTISAILLVLALMSVGRVFRLREVSTWYFFLLGAGFLLMETQLISRLALYFGSTWLVNAVALTAILVVLVLANVYVARRRLPHLKPYYTWLVILLLANYLFPWEQLPFEAQTVGILLSLGYSLPLFFAGVVFTEMFRRTHNKSAAFGANIVGAVTGGLVQNISFIVGLKALLLLGAVFYATASIFGRLLQAEPLSVPLGD